MNDLRLILLVFGVVIVGSVYLYSRLSAARGRASEDFEPQRREPGMPFDAEMDEAFDGLPPISADSSATYERSDEDDDAYIGDDATTLPKSARKEKIIALVILPASPEQRFLGSDLLEIFDRAGLEYGRFDVFHRVFESPQGPESVFSVASATEPGSFDVTEMADQTFKGLSLFMLLPGPQRGVDAFADMLATARRIAQQLDADVKDRNRSTLTKQTAHHIREEIIAFEHSLRQGH